MSNRKYKTLKDAVDGKILMKSKDECWPWIGTSRGNGYGCLVFGGRQICAHRAVYEINFGKLHKKLFVLHKCDNPICCNPSHLQAGSQKENIRQCLERNRHRYQINTARATHCKYGHEYNTENTIIYNGRGKDERRCRVCVYQRTAESKAKDPERFKKWCSNSYQRRKDKIRAYYREKSKAINLERISKCKS